MKYYFLGNSGLRVSELALGTMTFGTDWGWGAAPDEARKMLADEETLLQMAKASWDAIAR